MRPDTEADLAEMVRGTEGPFRIVGGGTRGVGRLAGAMPVIETGGLRGVSLYEPAALTLVAGAGTPLSEVEALVAAEGQRLAFEVPDWQGLLGVSGGSTLGGVVAANASGPRRVQAGACRDHLLGVRFVDGTGLAVKNGGRVMKNVTGYDLVKLMAGSFGTLGVLTEVSLKLVPMAETQASLCLRGLGDREALAAMSAALGSPFEVTGAAHSPGVGTHLRLEGFAASVAYRAGMLADHLAGFGVAEVETDPAAITTLWDGIRDVVPLQGAAGDIWRLSVTPSEAPGVVGRAAAEAVLYDWGGGRVWLRVTPGTDLRARLGQLAGHATRMRGEGPGPAFPPEPAGVAAITARLRTTFDPRGLFNPGLMET